MNDIRTEIEKRNKELQLKLIRAGCGLKNKLEEQSESAKILIKAGELLDYGMLIVDSYGNFSIMIDTDNTLVIYHDYSNNKKCIAWYDFLGLVYIKDNSKQMNAYSTIKIYNRLKENIEKLIDKAFVEIKNRYEKEEYCDNQQNIKRKEKGK